MADEPRPGDKPPPPPPPTVVGKSARVNVESTGLPTEVNANSPMTVAAYDKNTGMVTLQRQGVVIRSVPADALVEVPPPPDNPPAPTVPDAIPSP